MPRNTNYSQISQNDTFLLIPYNLEMLLNTLGQKMAGSHLSCLNTVQHCMPYLDALNYSYKGLKQI